MSDTYQFPPVDTSETTEEYAEGEKTVDGKSVKTATTGLGGATVDTIESLRDPRKAGKRFEAPNFFGYRDTAFSFYPDAPEAVATPPVNVPPVDTTPVATAAPVPPMLSGQPAVDPILDPGSGGRDPQGLSPGDPGFDANFGTTPVGEMSNEALYDIADKSDKYGLLAELALPTPLAFPVMLGRRDIEAEMADRITNSPADRADIAVRGGFDPRDIEAQGAPLATLPDVAVPAPDTSIPSIGIPEGPEAFGFGFGAEADAANVATDMAGEFGAGFRGGETPAEPGSGGAGGGNGTVICTELYLQGYLPADVLEADAAFGVWVRRCHPALYDGYIAWAPAYVRLMRRTDLVGKIAVSVAQAIAVPWAHSLAGKGGFVVGSLVSAFALPPVYALGLAIRLARRLRERNA